MLTNDASLVGRGLDPAEKSVNGQHYGELHIVDLTSCGLLCVDANRKVCGGVKTPPYRSSSSISFTSSPKRESAEWMGSGLLMSTPAIFRREIGSVLQPPERNFL